MLQERANERADRFEAEEYREQREIDRMKVFTEFAMKVIVSAVEEATKND